MIAASDCAFADLPDRLVVAPGFGAFSPEAPVVPTAEGELVREGQVLGTVVTSSGSVEVTAPCDAWLMAVLVKAGERVRPGRPLIHLRAL